MKRWSAWALALILTLCSLLSFPMPTAFATEEGKELKILFTHDNHSYYDVTTGDVEGTVKEHGGAGRLATILKENSDENTIYVDGGDFSMGTLLQAGYSTDAYELRLLGRLGCSVLTLGNHEFDYGGYGVAKMLKAAKASGDPLPQIVASNAVTTGTLNEEQKAVADAFAEYGVKEYTILEVNGLKVAVFGLMGEESVDDAPSSAIEFTDYIASAKETVKHIGDQADVIVCLSHSGTTGDGKTGEDFELAKKVPEIDVIISAHSHTSYPEAIYVGDTVIGSSGCYLSNVGEIILDVTGDKVTCKNYRVIPCDETVKGDEEIEAVVEGFEETVEKTYLAKEGVKYDQVIAKCPFDFMSLSEMYATHQEYPMGDLIADSYMYEAKRNGIDDIDVVAVGLGTIRGSFHKGDIKVTDAFEVCSLGVGADGSAGHPIIGVYVTGKELKLMLELDASLGPMVNSIKMSYSGIEYTFNEKRVILDRVTDCALVRADGTREKIQDDKLYKASLNMYAANMLGMLNGLTKGILTITLKDKDGNPLDDLYKSSLINRDGDEIKEWVALKNYLMSLEPVDGVPTIPNDYAQPMGRKVKESKGGLAIFARPGLTTCVAVILPTLLIMWIIWLLVSHKSRKAKRAARKAAKAAKKQ